MFRLHRGGRTPSRESRDVGGVEVPDVRSEHRPPFHSTHPAAFFAIGGRMFLKSLRYLGPGPKALRSHPRGCILRTCFGPFSRDSSAVHRALLWCGQ
jgi:hypothetical protein